jgi:hypothetical protein
MAAVAVAVVRKGEKLMTKSAKKYSAKESQTRYRQAEKEHWRPLETLKTTLERTHW